MLPQEAGQEKDGEWSPWEALKYPLNIMKSHHAVGEERGICSQLARAERRHLRRAGVQPWCSSLSKRLEWGTRGPRSPANLGRPLGPLRNRSGHSEGLVLGNKSTDNLYHQYWVAVHWICTVRTQRRDTFSYPHFTDLKSAAPFNRLTRFSFHISQLSLLPTF